MTIKKNYLLLFMLGALALGYGCARLVRDNISAGAGEEAEGQSSQAATGNEAASQSDEEASDGGTSTSEIGDTQNAGSYTTTKVTYAELPSGPLQFNLIKPSSGSNFPVVIWIHGGGFGPGGLNAAKGFEDDFTGEGYAIAALAYRSMLDGLFPTQIEDVKGAVRFLRSESAALDIDPNRIYLLGASSGGLLSSLAGVTGDELYVGTTGGNESFSSEVAGVVDLFGSVTKNILDTLSPTIIPTTYELFGCQTNTSCPDRAKLPIDNYISGDDPPFLIIHGANDETVPYEGSVELQALLSASGVEATLLTGEGYGHDKDGLIALYFDEIISFLDGH